MAGWRDFLLLTVVGAFVGIPGAIAWTTTEKRGWAAVLEAGPALLVPAIVLWTAISHYTCRNETECSDDWWRTFPFYAAVLAALAWHIALIARKDRSYFDWLYAALFLPLFYVYCMLTLAVAIKFPL